MVSNEDNWIRIFDIPDTSKHKKGFTIYKVISMLYPRNCPDSVTKVTVWKRYNDFKKLHRDIKGYHKALKMKDKLPSLPSTSYFNRFDEDIIQQRRTNILKFLEFVAIHPQLFMSDICVKFFKTSYTPSELLDSNILSIRAELNLPVESEYNLIRSHSDDERTISDTDSISTLSSNIDFLPDPLNQNASTVRVSKKLDISLTNSRTSSHDSLSLSTANVSLDGSTILEGQTFSTPPHTPNSLSAASPSYYILEASQCIGQAVDFEIARKYEEAFTAYKAGIDLLLKNVRDEKDYDRREMIRRKTEKYLLRAEKIYNIHLSPESKALQNYTMENENKKDTIQHPVSDLYKYKVVKVIASGMLVLHSDSQQLYYIKVIHKTSKFSNDRLILPGNVPYMVKLYNYYNCENALFLVLQYCSGTKLSEYIKLKSTNSEDILNASFCSNLTFCTNTSFNRDEEESDCDSEHSFTDLIHDYTSSRLERLNSKIKSVSLNTQNEHVTTEESAGTTELESSCESQPEAKVSESVSEISDLVVKSQELISSVDQTLHSPSVKNVSHSSVSKINELEQTETHIAKSTKSSRKSSERSEWSLFDDFQISENSLLPIQDVIKWAAQFLLALERLHLVGVICCDLQTKNLLIDETGDLVLTYMCNVTEKYDIAFSNTNDLTLAPELHSFQPITEAVDWWSFGAVLYEMLVGMPLMSIHPEGLTAYTILKIPKYVTVEGRSLLKQLLAYEPHERLGSGINAAEDIKSHPFFNSVLWDVLASKNKI